ncbi:hypothetical protein OBP_288 [Pseudomonas phage OBP]|uniref:hypothetical protein n=1 Tax=Pseudomonas phage OBP TaxID=1124849 RepID=UPI000240D63B|nr:hypothetical protein OBP_288 [Pseudomonas phage OBP]AEV89725.1 hypothetical protein OBP_288 [Pseudomonas phage OBP]
MTGEPLTSVINQPISEELIMKEANVIPTPNKGYVKNIGTFTLPVPSYCMVLSKFQLSYALVYDENIQFVQDHNVSPALTKDDARAILMGIADVERLEKEKRYDIFKKKIVKISGGREFTIAGLGYRLGNVHIHGREEMARLKDLLTAFVWGKSRNEMGPFTIDLGEIRTHGEIERFGNVSKYVTWSIRINDGLCVEDRGRLDIVGPYDGIRYHFGTEEILSEIIKGVKTLLNSDATEYRFTEEKAVSVGLRLFKTTIHDGSIAVGISTDILLPNQRTFMFLGKESGEKFLKFLRKGKKLFK